MKIAQVVPLYEAVPPRLYGGTERVAAHLTDALVHLGHEVTLFASAEAETRAALVPVRDQAIRLDPAPLKSDLAAHLAMLAEVRRRAGEFDVIHFHTDMLHFPMFEDVAERTITTLHGRLDLKDLPEVYRRWTAYPLVSVSDEQRKPLPCANWIGTVHHGTPAEQYAFHLRSEGYLAFLGRVSPEKRPDRAIEIARGCGKRLKMAAKVDAADRRYWSEVIEPMIRAEPLVEFIGEIGDTGKSAFLSDPGSDGAAVLAEGEMTGHRHAIYDRVTMFRDDSLAHDIPNGLYVGHIRVDEPCARIQHDEHDAVTLPKGTYRVRRQRELEPKDARIVAD